MFKVKRLFWKIFFAFWLANLIVLGASIALVFGALESDRFKVRHQQHVQKLATRAITFLENAHKEDVTDASQRRAKAWQDKRFTRKMNHKHPFRLYENETLIFEFRSAHLDKKKLYTLPVSAPDGRQFKIETLPPKPPKIFIEVFKKLNVLQFFLILIVSMLVSVVLSWRITKPLKRLGAYSRQWDGADTCQLDTSLLARHDEIGQLARDFQKMTVEVQKHVAAQQRLLHDVSHELRAPLARLQTAAAIVQQKSPENAEYVKRIDHECERVDQLIHSILSLSRTGYSHADRDTISLKQLTRAAIELVQFEYTEHSITLSAERDDNILSVPELVSSAIENILRNACKYSDPSAIINVSILHDNGRILLKIRDHGPGIDEEELPKITTPFYRAGNKMHTDGVGLGLSIAQRAMQKNKGELNIANHPEGGLVVTLFFETSGPNKKTIYEE